MSTDVLTFDLARIRGTDSNSLLRMYDLACSIVAKSTSQQERARADKIVQRLVKELQKRKVSF